MTGVSQNSFYVVVVAGNLVSAIHPTSEPDQSAATGTALEIGTALAGNFQRSGSIDGRYGFDSAAEAKRFALLCLQFSKALVERRIGLIEALPPEFESYFADEQPRGGMDA